MMIGPVVGVYELSVTVPAFVLGFSTPMNEPGAIDNERPVEAAIVLDPVPTVTN